MKKFVLLIATIAGFGSVANAYTVDCQCPKTTTCASFTFDVDPNNLDYMTVRYGNGNGELRIIEGVPVKQALFTNNNLSAETLSLGRMVLKLEDGKYSMPGREVSCERK